MAPEKNNNQLQKIINRSDVSILSTSEIQLLEGAVKHILAKKDYELLIKIFSIGAYKIFFRYYCTEYH